MSALLISMRGIVIHFLRLEVLNLHPMVYWGLAGVWILILVSAFISVRSLSISTGAKAGWFFLIIAVPILGLTTYSLRCLFKNDWRAFEFLFHSRSLVRQISSVEPSINPAKKA